MKKPLQILRYIKNYSGCITGILLFMHCVAFHTSSFAQENALKQRITLQKENVSLEEIFKELEAKHRLYFSYTHETLPEHHTVSVSANELPLDLFLNEIFKGTQINYTIADNYIILINQKPRLRHAKKSGYTNALGSFNKSRPLSLTQEVTVGSSFRNLSSSSSEGKNAIGWRKNEQARVGFSSQFTVSYTFKSGLIAGTGIGILMVGEKGNCTFTETERYFDRYNRYTATTRTYDYDYTNNYTFFTMPVFIGYRYKLNSIRFSAYAGVSPSLLLDTHQSLGYYNYYEYITYSNLSPYRRDDIPAPKETAYKTFLLWYTFKATVQYNRSRFTYSLGPSYQHLISSLYKSSAPLKQNSYLLGISGSISYSF